MSKKDDYIQNRKLEEFSDLGINSTRDNIYNSSKEESRKDYIMDYNERSLQKNNYSYKRNINIEANENPTSNSKKETEPPQSLYEQLVQANEAKQSLHHENFNLKQVIKNKDSIIYEYEETIKKAAEKIIKLQKINEKLKRQLKVEKQNTNAYEIENINNNQYLLESINDIKNNIGMIEDNFEQKIIEREDIINQLNYDLQLNNDYKMKVNQYLNSVYSENDYLKTQICCLLKEKEILLNQKEKDHNEIIRLNKILLDNPNDKNIIKVDKIKKEYEEKERQLIFEVNNKEKEFVLQSSNLHRAIVEREKEIDDIKEKYQDVIMKLELEIEGLKHRLNAIENAPIKNDLL